MTTYQSIIDAINNEDDERENNEGKKIVYRNSIGNKTNTQPVHF